MRTGIIFLFFLVLSPSAFSQYDGCFSGTLPYFQNVRRASGSAAQRMLMLNRGCAELRRGDMTDAPGIGSAILSNVGESLSLPLAGQAWAAFSTLNGNENQRRYRRQLDEIKRIPNPMERIRRVYELVARTQGSYNYGSNAIRLGTPGNLIDTAAREGSAGVCRDFAALLQWSLMQVARYSGSTRMDLGPTDFSSEIKTGSTPSGGHAWVRVNLPNHDAQGRITGFNRFDLDTTWYPEQFSVLFPRNSSLSEGNRTRLVRECSTVVNCLSLAAAQEFGPGPGSSSSSSAGQGGNGWLTSPDSGGRKDQAPSRSNR